MLSAAELNNRAQRDSARIYLKQALHCAKKLERKDLEAQALFKMGIVEFRDVQPRDTPTRLFLESLALYTELQDSEGVIKCNLQLGVLNYDLRNFEAALSYFNNILNTRTEDTQMVALAHYLSALCFSELKSFAQAEQMFDRAVREVNQTDSVFHLQVLAFKGKMYSNQGKAHQAIVLLNQVMKDNSSTIQKEGFSPIFAFLSTAYLQVHDYDNAIAYGREAYKQSVGSGTNTIYLREAEATLHRALFSIGQIDSAYFYLKVLSGLEDSVTNDQVLQRVAEMSGQFEFQQKLKTQRAEQELRDKLAEKEIERQKLLRNLLLLAFVLVGAFAVVFFRQRTKISREKDRSDKLLLNILPHTRPK